MQGGREGHEFSQPPPKRDAAAERLGAPWHCCSAAGATPGEADGHARVEVRGAVEALLPVVDLRRAGDHAAGHGLAVGARGDGVAVPSAARGADHGFVGGVGHACKQCVCVGGGGSGSAPVLSVWARLGRRQPAAPRARRLSCVCCVCCPGLPPTDDVGEAQPAAHHLGPVGEQVGINDNVLAGGRKDSGGRRGGEGARGSGRRGAAARAAVPMQAWRESGCDIGKQAGGAPGCRAGRRGSSPQGRRPGRGRRGRPRPAAPAARLRRAPAGEREGWGAAGWGCSRQPQCTGGVRQKRVTSASAAGGSCRRRCCHCWRTAQPGGWPHSPSAWCSAGWEGQGGRGA